MAKKRASARGKGPGSPGAGEEKGKGIDLLFGGAPEQEEDEVVDVTPGASQATAEPVASGTAFTAPPPPPPPTPDAMPIESLPVNEADDEEEEMTFSGGMVDELGLPVAMEAPPPDLELAVPGEASTPGAMQPPPTGTDFTLPPSAFEPAPPVAGSPPPDLGDELTLDLSDEDLSELDELESGPSDDTTLSGVDFGEIEEIGVSPTPGPTTTGLPPVSTPPVEPVSALPPVSPTWPEEPVTPPTFPATTTPPVTPPVSAPPTFPATTTPPVSTTPPVTPPSPPPPLTPSIAPPRARIDSVGGIVSEKIQVVEKDILPDDTTYSVTPTSGVLAVADRAQVERDELVSQKVTRYIGRERRERLDKDIEELYGEVARELSVNTTDTEFALRTLSQAQDIIFEDARQYDEALYRVAIVRTMIARKQNLRRWSYTWGSAVFFYAIVWLAVFIAGFLLTGQIRQMLNSSAVSSEITTAPEATITSEIATAPEATITSESVTAPEPTIDSDIMAVRAAWFSALAGGIGGVIGILYSLYWHVAMKQDFDRQYVMYYLVQPVMGFILGAVVYFIIGAGFLIVNFASQTGAGAETVLSSSTVVALQIVLGWIAGFRQRFVFEMIDKIVQRLSPREEEGESKEPISVVPADQLGTPSSRR